MRYLALTMVFAWMAALLGYMELQHEVEHVAPRTALVTDHFTGEVRQCRTYPNSDWSCHAVEIEPRSWVFALIPFWPARDDLGEVLSLPGPSGEPASFTENQLFSDLVSNGIMALVMLVVGLIIMRARDDGEGGSADGGSDGGGAGGGGGE